MIEWPWMGYCPLDKMKVPYEKKIFFDLLSLGNKKKLNILKIGTVLLKRSNICQLSYNLIKICSGKADLKYRNTENIENILFQYFFSKASFYKSSCRSSRDLYT